MDDKDKMLRYMTLVEQAAKKLEALAPTIDREVERQFGHKILRARTEQERKNLRQYYTVQVGRENIWKQAYLSEQDLYIRLATMHGIAALVEQTEVKLEPF